MFYLTCTLLAVVWSDPDWWSVLVWSGRFLGVLFVPSVLLQRSTRPMAALTWILVLIFLPFVGVILWWGLGRNFMRRTGRRRTRARRQLERSFHNLERAEFPESSDSSHKAADEAANEPVDDAISELLPAQYEVTEDDDLEEHLKDVLRDQYDLFPPTRRNTIAIHHSSRTAFDAYFAAIERAEHHIHFQFYVFREDETGTRFRDLLVEKARQGVEVRVLYDAMGSVSLGRRFFDPLIAAGGKTAPFLPIHIWESRLRINFRNHRKLLIIDGRVGCTGGVNIADEYLEWFDMGFTLNGPVVQQMQEVFAEDWYFATREDLAALEYFPSLHRSFVDLTASLPSDQRVHQSSAARVVASGPDDRLDTIHKMFFMAITSAEKRLFIITPYFVPDSAILTALQTAAMRGVDVRVIVPGRSDVPLTQHAGRTFWESLMEAGVRIFEYQDSILHTKLLLMDTTHSLLGSANLDVRSFRFNFEVNVVVESRSFNQAMSAIYEDALLESDEVELDEFRLRSRRSRLIEGTARLFSPLL